MPDDPTKDPAFLAAAAQQQALHMQGKVFSIAYNGVLRSVQTLLDALATQGLTPQDGCAQVHAAVIAVEAGLSRLAMGPLGVTTAQMTAHVETHQKIGDRLYAQAWQPVLSARTGAMQLCPQRDSGILGPDGRPVS